MNEFDPYHRPNPLEPGSAASPPPPGVQPPPYPPSPSFYSNGNTPDEPQRYYAQVPGQPSWMPPVVVETKKSRGETVNRIISGIVLILLLLGVGFAILYFYHQDNRSFLKINAYITGQQNSDLERYLNENPKADINGCDADNLPPIYTAVQEKNQRALELLLDHGADLNLKDPYDDTGILTSPLNAAIINENLEAAKLLIERGCDLESKNGVGYTPLILSTFIETPFVEALISGGAKVNAQEENGFTALHYAAYNGNEDTYLLLVENGANEQALSTEGLNMTQMALNGDEIGMISFLEERNIMLEAPTLVGGKTLLHLAGSQDALEYVFLHCTLPPINSQDAGGETALCYNSDLLDVDGVQMLLDKGADPNIQSKQGMTALMYACANPNDADGVLDALLDGGADPSLKDHSGKTAYDYALSYDNISDFVLQRLQPEEAIAA